MKPKTLLLLLLLLTVATPNIFAQQIEELQKILPEHRAELTRFGNRVVFQNERLLVPVAADDYDEGGLNYLWNAGAVYLFNWNENEQEWIQFQKLVSPHRSEYELFGNDACFHGEYLIVGATLSQTDENDQNPVEYAGSVYIFKEAQSGQFEFYQKVVAPQRNPEAYFGSNVESNGTHLMISASNNDYTSGSMIEGTGSIEIFELSSADSFIHSQQLWASDQEYLTSLGGILSMDGNRLLASSAREKAYYFEYDISANEWLEKQVIQLTPSRIRSFGSVVGLSGEYATIGANRDALDENNSDSLYNCGAIYLYKLSSGSWSLQQKIVSPFRQHERFFGIDLELKNGKLLMGNYTAEFSSNPSDTDTVGYSGIAYYATINGSGTIDSMTYIVCSERTSSQYFGSSVCLTDSQIVIGALGETRNDQGQNLLYSAGAIYTYRIINTVGLGELTTRSASIQLFPNPSSSFVEIKSSTSRSYSIFNGEGKLIRTDSYINTKSRIDVRNWRPGIYHVVEAEGNTGSFIVH